MKFNHFGEGKKTIEGEQQQTERKEMKKNYLNDFYNKKI